MEGPGQGGCCDHEFTSFHLFEASYFRSSVIQEARFHGESSVEMTVGEGPELQIPNCGFGEIVVGSCGGLMNLLACGLLVGYNGLHEPVIVFA